MGMGGYEYACGHGARDAAWGLAYCCICARQALGGGLAVQRWRTEVSRASLGRWEGHEVRRVWVPQGQGGKGRAWDRTWV